jgi:hypothetical protein
MESENVIDVACVIHGDLYKWQYVQNLHAMVKRHLDCPVRFHVFTESGRAVPPTMIKHELEDWAGVHGRRRAWWYKMQLFNPAHGIKQILYFDLDVVVTGSLSWITGCRTDYFWALKDFKYIWRPNWTGINSSVMWWNVEAFQHIWTNFKERNITAVTKQYPGDQDFLSAHIDLKNTRYFEEQYIRSWRWQVLDGGMDMKSRTVHKPNAGAVIDSNTRVVVFHGSPKPHEITDPTIVQHWQ